MGGVLDDICWLLGAVLLTIGLVLLVRTRIVKRWKRHMDVSDDTHYVEMLATLF